MGEEALFDSIQRDLLAYSAKSLAVLVTMLGSIVLIGWYTENSALIQVNPLFVPMQYNTALGFVLAGLGLLALVQRSIHTTRWLGALVSVLGALTLLQYLLSVDFSIDQLFMQHYIDVNVSHPGRMAPNTALCFFLSGAALVVSSLGNRNSLLAISASLGSVVFALGVVAFGGYAANLETAYGWGALTKMAVHTSIGFIVLGVGLLLVAMQRYRKSNEGTLPAWLPWTVGFSGLTLTGAAWQASRAKELTMVAQLGEGASSIDDESLLVFGMLATVSFALWVKDKVSKPNDSHTGNFAIVAVISLGVALALGMHQLLDGIHKNTVIGRFDQAFDNRLKAIEYGVRPYIDSLYDIQTGFAASEEVSRSEFSILTKHDLVDLPGILSLQWVPMVFHAERKEFEAAESQWSQQAKTIIQLDENGSVIPSPEREVYFPVQYFEPRASNANAHLFDIGTNPPGVEVLWDTVEQQSLLVSQRLDLVQFDTERYGVVLSLPIYENGSEIDTATQRRQALKGFAIAVLDIGAMIDKIFEEMTLPAGLNLRFEEELKSGDRALLYFHRSRLDVEGNLDSLFTKTRTMNLGHRQWLVTASAIDIERYRPWSSSSLVLPLFTILFTLVLAGYIRRSAAREQERTLLLKELAKREGNFRALVSTIPGAAYSCLLDRDNSMIYISKEIEALTGKPPSEFLLNEVTLSQFIHPDDVQSVNEGISQALMEKRPYVLEYRVIATDGTERWVYDKGAVLYADGDGRDELHGTILDITERKHSEARFRGLLESAPDSMVIVNELGLISFVNQQTEELFGYDSDELLGKPVEILLPERFSKQHPSLRMAYFSDPKVRQMGASTELAAAAKNGDEIPVEISLSPLQTSSGLLVSAAIRDISVRKTLEGEIVQARDRAEQATRAKSEFLANMSHEIRTPMNSIIGMSQLALQAGLAPKQRNYVEKVHRSAELLLNIINDILDFSKIEAGKLELEQSPFGLDTVFHNMINVLGLQAEDKGLELLFDLPPELPAEIIGDGLRLGQVLLNLGNNAIKFTERGEVVVAVEILEQTDEAVTLQFSVTDTGVGMTEEQQGSLFQAFSQADASTTRKFGGTGLGLTICQRLVSLMEGEISVSSEYGKGSRFSFTASFEKSSEACDKSVLLPKDLAGLKVLIVDDNASSREILASTTKGFGFQVDVCSDGADALTLIQGHSANNPYELVLMDWKMPEMDGIETTRAIQNLDIEEMPTCIMVTAYGKDEAADAAKGLAIKSFLTKPITPSTLLDSILMAMGHKALRQAHDSRIVVDNSRWIDQIAGAHILLVEDNEFNQELAVALLTQNGMTVDVALDGQQALDQLQKGRYDGVLMDCQMPVMDGYTATRKLREDPQFSDLPVLAMTANAMAGDREKALAAGMNDHIAKPINPNVMFRTMADWIQPKVIGAASANSMEASGPHELQSLDISGLDIKTGLSYVQDNYALYEKLLSRFARERANFEEDFSNMQAAEDVDAGMRYAHTLASSAATLGATEVAKTAKQLEKACLEKTATEALVDSLSASLRELVDNINLALTSLENTPVQVDDASMSEKSSTISIAKIERIKQSAIQSDSDSLNQVDELLASYSGAEHFDDLKRIGEALHLFDFEAAVEAIDQLLDKLK
ncbi:MAG: hypothetical protein CL693_03395 [Cellvibrionaceae bacterium]|nr:hypothetical protein [Cellvibrionaceae bacterium]